MHLLSPTHSALHGTYALSPVQRILLFLKLLRVSNWIKNILIFFPLVFSEKLLEPYFVKQCIVGFFAFSFLASAIYIINDSADIEADRKHPVKRMRPLASGAISKFTAYTSVMFLVSAAFILAALHFSHGVIWLVIYFLANLLYSFRLKAISLLDVFMITLFFEIRLFFGSTLADCEVSPWLCLLTFFLAIFITFCKRRDDFALISSGHEDIRKSLASYNFDFLNAIILLIASVLLVIYILYSLSPEGGVKYTPYFYTSSFFVFLCICRYLQLIFVFKKGGDPVQLFYSDGIILFSCVAWVCSLVSLIYL